MGRKEAIGVEFRSQGQQIQPCQALTCLGINLTLLAEHGHSQVLLPMDAPQFGFLGFLRLSVNPPS